MNVLTMILMNDSIQKNIVKDIEIEYIEDENGRLIYSKNVEKKKKENKYIDYKQKSIEILSSFNQGFSNISWAKYTYDYIKGHTNSEKEAYYYILKNYSNNGGY